jgi:hypothetical protein
MGTSPDTVGGQAGSRLFQSAQADPRRTAILPALAPQTTGPEPWRFVTHDSQYGNFPVFFFAQYGQVQICAMPEFVNRLPVVWMVTAPPQGAQ